MARQPVAALDRLGKALVQARDFNEAVALLRQAQRLYPHDFWINYDLASTFASSEPAQHDEAIRYFTAAVALSPDSPGANVARGNSWADKKEYDEAIADYDQAIRLDPNFATAHIKARLRLVRQAGVRQGHRRLLRGDTPLPRG